MASRLVCIANSHKANIKRARRRRVASAKESYAGISERGKRSLSLWTKGVAAVSRPP